MRKSSAEEIATACGKAKKSGAEWLCCCPAHQDKTPSLSVKDEGDKVLFKCFAGCSQADVLSALKDKGLWSNGVKRKRKPSGPFFYVRHHDYFDASGNYLYTHEVQKDAQGKKKTPFYVRKFDGTKLSGRPGKGILYNLPAVKRAIGEGKPVFIVEGEGCVDKLTEWGLTATCNDNGSNKWHDGLTAELKGAPFIFILPDNDEPGRKHAERVTNELYDHVGEIRVVELPGLPEKGDIVDWVCESIGGTKTRLKELVGASKKVEKKPEVVPEFTRYEKYLHFLTEKLGKKEIRRCILSDIAKIRVAKKWENLFTRGRLASLRSAARDTKDIKAYYLEDDLRKYVSELEPKLILDLPPWDGRDRILEVAKCLNVTNVSQEEAAELIKHWGVVMWNRIRDPKLQNTCLILQGKQGHGKDSVINTLTDGLGGYSVAPSLEGNNEQNLFLAIKDSVVIKIPEFDRTSKMQSATLKDIITRDKVHLVKKYENDPQTYELHCSFISSCNIADIFVDFTGNRRFWVLELDKKKGVEWEYPNSEQDKAQIIAQYKTLAEQGYQASEATIKKMVDYVEEKTPDDPEQLMLEHFDQLVWELAGTPESKLEDRKAHGQFTNQELGEIFKTLQSEHGWPVRTIRRKLKISGRSCWVDQVRGYRALELPINETPEEQYERLLRERLDEMGVYD